MLGKVIRIALFAAVIGLVGVAIFRPATLFGVSSKALANSVGSEAGHSSAKCVSGGSDVWRCRLTGGKAAGVEYTVMTHRYGCWTGYQVRTRSSTELAKQSVSGCIGLTDLLSN